MTIKNNQQENGSRRPILNLRLGEVVEVRPEVEIAATLDKQGTLEGVPFMPEMRKFCGQRLKVVKSVKKIVVEESGLGMRQLKNTASLDGVNCDGEFHGGCQRTCRLLWKEAWLKRYSVNSPETLIADAPPTQQNSPKSAVLKENAYYCQSTSLVAATSPLARWDARQYIWDITSGTYKPFERLMYLMKSGLYRVAKIFRREPPRSIRGQLKKTPVTTTCLQPGDMVEVKTKEEILQTLDPEGKNRGLVFMPEMLQYCGKKFLVLKRVDQMINEATGRMRGLTNTVLLEGCTCDGKAHGGCQRMCYSCWREIWLRKVS